MGIVFPSSSHSASPPLRVGITGARRIPQERLETIAADLSALLRYVRDEARAFGVGRIVMISPLAEGADRLAAEAALTLGFDLFAPLPFPAREYERDFPDSVDGFRSLAARARILEFDGGRGDCETASYEAVGRFVATQSDVLVALWDGKPAKGRGGTADIVRFAVRRGVPVYWINLDTSDQIMLASVEDLDRRGSPSADSRAALSRLVASLSSAGPIPAADAPQDVASWWASQASAAALAAERIGEPLRMARSLAKICASLLFATLLFTGISLASPAVLAAQAALAALAAITLAASLGRRRQERQDLKTIAEICAAQGAIAPLGGALEDALRFAEDIDDKASVAAAFRRLVRWAPPPVGSLPADMAALSSAGRDALALLICRFEAECAAGARARRARLLGWISICAAAGVGAAAAALGGAATTLQEEMWRSAFVGLCGLGLGSLAFGIRADARRACAEAQTALGQLRILQRKLNGVDASAPLASVRFVEVLRAAGLVALKLTRGWSKLYWPEMGPQD